MKRNKFNLGYTKLLTCNMGQLVPIGLTEVLPGDSIQMNTAALVRAAPLVAPVMHPVDVRIHHWFVPHRLLWFNWETFITGGPDGLDASKFPTRTPSNSAAVGSLADYYGVPTGVNNVEVSGLPFRGYQYIFNEWYRDQDLQAEVAFDGGDGPDSLTNTTLQNIGWEKDYYTSSRPWEQKGPSVTIPIGTSAPVVFSETGATPGTRTLTRSQAAPPANVQVGFNGTAGAPIVATADLTATAGVTVNQLRQSLALQRFEEARARYGSRYPEYLRALGVSSSDARLQRPEFLGGGRQRISFSEVLQTAGDGTNPVATMRGHGIAAMRSNRFRRFFEEHGYIHTLMSVRPKTIYMNGLPRHFQRKVKTDFWQRELEHIGQQQVLLNEVYMQPGATGKAVFGYQDRYDEYRRAESQVSGEFRTISAFWHMARDFAAAPALNSSFVSCVPSPRSFAITSAHQLMVQVKHSIVARRLLARVGSSHTF